MLRSFISVFYIFRKSTDIQYVKQNLRINSFGLHLYNIFLLSLTVATIITVELGYNVMKRPEYFVSL
jgi:hypothetical protein